MTEPEAIKILEVVFRIDDAYYHEYVVADLAENFPDNDWFRRADEAIRKGTFSTLDKFLGRPEQD